MKQYLRFAPALMLGALAAVGLPSCGPEKASPEDEVRSYANYFVEKLNANQKDSLLATYPDLNIADSLATLRPDTIIVEQGEASGSYVVRLTPEALLKLTLADDGAISVTESRGLFLYPQEREEIAKKTGMWDDKLSDKELASRMKDDAFFDYIKKTKTVSPGSIITLGKMVGNGYMDVNNYQYVVNNTDQPIKGSDYTVTYLDEWMPYSEDDPGKEWHSKPGKDIPPHGSVKYEVSCSNRGMDAPKSIKLKLSPEQIQERFAPSYTGTEYQEYLASKQSN